MLRAVALLLTVLTGFSGLVYEVTWQKCLATLLGSHSEATAAVLGIFLGGLAVGYSLFGRITRSLVTKARHRGGSPPLLLFYGGVEATIGLYALIFPLLFGLAESLSLAIPHGNEGLGFAVDVFLTALLIGPPTVLMGGTIPILTQALARGLDDATRVHAFVYGFNTAGAFAGAIAAGFFLIPWLGIHGTLRSMGIVNLVAGASFLALGVRWRGGRFDAGARSEEPRVAGFAVFAGVAVLLGFSMMSLQTVLIRVGGLALGASHFTFAMVVAVFVLCIALGSLAVSAIREIRPTFLAACVWGYVAVLIILYSEVQNAPYHAHVLRSIFQSIDAAFYPYYISAFVGVLLVFGLPVGLAGATLPLLFHHLRREVGDLGSVAGRLYSWNTVGNLLGALLGGYALLFWLDLHHIYRLAIIAAAVGATALMIRILDVSRWWAGGLLIVLTVLVARLPAWSPDRLSAGAFRNREASIVSYHGADFFFANVIRSTNLFYDDDPTTSVAVKEHLSPDGKTLSRAIVNNGKSDGDLVSDYPTMALVAIIPCLIADECERSFVIGYGTGVTVGEFAAQESMQEVVVAEISRGVIEAAPFFEEGNLHAAQNPKVRIERGDAYRTLLRSEGSYDVIASEPSNPWVTGVEMLFSREFLAAARARLRPGGVYAQWFHVYEVDTPTVELVLRTYASVFDHVSVWYASHGDLIILGLTEPQGILDLDRLSRRAQSAEFAPALARAGIPSFPALLAHELLPLGVIERESLPGEIHTLFHPILSHRAARAFFRNAQAALPQTANLRSARAGFRNSLLRRWLAGTDPSQREEIRFAVLTEHCRNIRELECATHVAEWLRTAPDADRVATSLAEWRRAPLLREHLEPERLQELMSLYGNGARERRPSFEEAQSLTNLFARYYQHDIPFRRGALRTTWNRCEDPAGRCAEGRQVARRRLGGLGTLDSGPANRRRGRPRGSD